MICANLMRDGFEMAIRSPSVGALDVLGLPPVTAVPMTVVQRADECGTDGRRADALRELIG